MRVQGAFVEKKPSRQVHLGPKNRRKFIMQPFVRFDLAPYPTH